jgi:hypothetical protein
MTEQSKREENGMNGDNGCPHRTGCFIIGSLQAIPIPSIQNYCARSFSSCRYYQRQAQAMREEKLKEVCA